MDPDSASQSYIERGLEAFGIEAGELELAVIRGIWDVYRAPLELLLAADLTEVEPEPGHDLSRAPSR